MKKGDFVRAWYGNRPDELIDYEFGYYFSSDFREGHHINTAGKIIWVEHAEPATTQPEWAEPRRRVIADRTKLCRVLLDMGYEPDKDGDFSTAGKPLFFTHMWEFAGMPVEEWGESINYFVKGYIILPEWTEEY